ncbi:GDSL esterase/lipase At5g03610-like [Hibiscus syriacus]|uniref:GDSL esterase/lipase At5g03610-like n=1 Tax=Hibiscus syriacus TaxID=106335 RepID=UPI00192453E0|nr:GDSL esterase/lipase At5g03610-like [Hibiscus syriacus]
MPFSFFHLLFCITVIFSEVHAVHEQHFQHASKSESKSNVTLFVFGDSYVDTGNWRKSVGGSWKEPYGITFPGKPSGRFSDGRVLTDYIASYLGTITPTAYQWRKGVKRSNLKYGMNFAYGGTGVLDTPVNQPNMTTQIDYFQRLIREKVYKKQDLDNSVAIVSVAGNDYAAYLARNADDDLRKLPAFTKTIMKQLGINLERIQGLGVKRIAVTLIEPMGCVPVQAASLSYTNCSEVLNIGSKLHNQMLQQALKNLNDKTNSTLFVTLDLYDAFISALNKLTKRASASSGMKNPLKPCCDGKEKGKYYCGSVDESGAKQYSICENPNLSLFWDTVHPSQNGWRTIFSSLRSSLHKLIT